MSGNATTSSAVGLAPSPAADGPSNRPERRAAARYRLTGTVSVGRSESLPVTASMVDVSIGGAAVRLEPRVHMQEWTQHLAAGEEIWLGGLLRDPITCWVVALDGDLLRLRFWHDDLTRSELKALIAGIAAVPGAPAPRGRAGWLPALLGFAGAVFVVASAALAVKLAPANRAIAPDPFAPPVEIAGVTGRVVNWEAPRPPAAEAIRGTARGVSSLAANPPLSDDGADAPPERQGAGPSGPPIRIGFSKKCGSTSVLFCVPRALVTE